MLSLKEDLWLALNRLKQSSLPVRAPPTDQALFDRTLVLQRRRRAAAALPRHDFLLRHAADEIAFRISAVLRQFPRALDLGAHHGLIARTLAENAAIGQVIALDPCPDLLRASPGPTVCAYEELLPFADASLDLVVSAFGLQFVNDLPGALIQIRRALRPDGLFLAAILGGRTLGELADALLSAEAWLTGGASPRVGPFADVRDLGALLQRAGFALPVADAETLTVTYASALELMHDLRGMGAGNMLAARSRRPLSRAVLGQALQNYDERYSAGNGRVRATFEIVWLTGWAPHESQQQPLRPGTARMRLADALGTCERPAGEKTPGPDEHTSG